MTGKRIVNTRATHQNSRFTALLQAHGAEVIEYPCIAIAPPENDAPLRAALAELATFDWIVLTSANTVLGISALTPASSLGHPSPNVLVPRPGCPLGGERGQGSGFPPFSQRGLRNEGRWEKGAGGMRATIPKLAAVGPATAKAAKTYLGLETTLLPETFTAEALGEVLPILPGQRVLIPASAIAPPTLAEQLTARGAVVTVVEAYRTVQGTGGAEVPTLLAQRRVDAVTFTSASTVENFLARLESEGGSRAELAGVCIACIGPQTAAAAEAHGLRVEVMPAEHTLDGLIAALGDFFAPAR